MLSFIRSKAASLVRDLGSTNGTFINGSRLFEPAELRADDVVQFADVPLRVEYSCPKKESHTASENFCDHALARVQFDKLLREEIVVPHFQPIVDLSTGFTKAFEVLARSRLIGLETPGRMFAVASELQMEARLSDLMRRTGIEGSPEFDDIPPIYLNTHPVEFKNHSAWDWILRRRDGSDAETRDRSP